MSAIRTYNYNMGFAINGIPIPDPSGFSGSDSDLDASGERDATGYLHRAKVAMKRPLKVKYKNWEWGKMQEILTMLTNDRFSFTYPDPSRGGALRTIEAYAGDRDWDVVLITQLNTYVGNLEFSVIEY